MKKLPLMILALLFVTLCLYAQTDNSIIIRNETGYILTDIYFSPSAYDDWEDDFIPDGELQDGEEVDIPLNRDIDDNETIYDLQAVDEDNDYYTIYEIDITENPVVRVTMDAYDGGDYNDYDYDYEGYEKGYSEGYNEGYKQGYIEAFRDAYLEGFKAGQETDVPVMPERNDGYDSQGGWR